MLSPASQEVRKMRNIVSKIIEFLTVVVFAIETHLFRVAGESCLIGYALKECLVKRFIDRVTEFLILFVFLFLAYYWIKPNKKT